MTDTSAEAPLIGEGDRYRPLRGSTVAEVADRKRVSRATIYNEARAGRIKLSKVCGRTVIFEQDEAEYDATLLAENEARRANPPKAA